MHKVYGASRGRQKTEFASFNTKLQFHHSPNSLDRNSFANLVEHILYWLFINMTQPSSVSFLHLLPILTDPDTVSNAAYSNLSPTPIISHIAGLDANLPSKQYSVDCSPSKGYLHIPPFRSTAGGAPTANLGNGMFCVDSLGALRPVCHRQKPTGRLIAFPLA